jgi:hypothetical protein
MKIDTMIEHGAGRAEVEALPIIQFTPTLAPEALHGLAGRIVNAIGPHSEADPVAILVHVLVAAGNLIGRGPHALVEETAHPCNEFAALVGRTAKGRKGQAWSTPRHMFAYVDEPWAKYRIKSGLSSGEGLIYNVRDARTETQPIRERGRVVDYQTVTVDEGEPDKRLLVFEPELAIILKRMAGETNSLSGVIRDAWDTGALSTLTKNSPLRAIGAHISIIAHVTEEELIASLTETERANGFANRFMFFMVRRSKALPDGDPVPAGILAPFIEELQAVARWAQEPRRLVRDPSARALWAAVYPELSEGEPGLLGAVLGRAEAHALRLSLIYAVLDRSPSILEEHLNAALAVWDYAEASARRIFGDRLGLSTADRILSALRARGSMTKTEITDMFNRNKPAAEIDAVLTLLREKGKAKKTIRPPQDGKGRPAEVWETA